MSQNTRKRPAPGASPMVPYQQQRMQQPFGAGNVNDGMLQWNGSNNEFINPSAHDPNAYGLVHAQQNFGQVPATSNSMALVPKHNRAMEPWAGFGGDGDLYQPDNQEGMADQDNIEVLEEMAQKAKREARSKRKSIPPFVQKLSSFLEGGKNDDLIRWSDKGDSFIVLDEDEFAKTLIPNLYKHNKYASFVRQLNMYGFHKRVGLSDNSMRASERKHKNPSEYHNPFFRRGHPNLLWLINKTKSKAPAKTKGEDDGEGDDDLVEGGADGTGAQGSGPSSGRALPAAGDSQQSGAPKKEMSVIRDELTKVRDQQKMILSAINRLQRNNTDLYNQALMFQNQHDRHQNSINAILNFLANVFRKTLEDQGNSQNINDIISSMITNQGQGGAHNQASVVDLGDLFSAQADPTGSFGGVNKRARGLLPPIPNQDNSGSARPSTTASSRSATTGSTPYYPVGGHNNPEMGHVTELADGTDTPPSLRQELENNPHERMMKIINDHNATNKSGMDLPEAEELVANAPNALNRDQRSKLVDFMAGQSSASPPSASQTPTTSGGPTASPPIARAPAASSVKPSVETTGGGANTTAAPSLSPIMRSPQAVPPSINEINTNQMDLDQLQRLQSQQDAKIQELSEMLGPLSPSGHIPGLGEGEDGYFNEPSNVDLDQFFDSNAFLNDANFGSDGNDFNFNIDGDGNAHGGGGDGGDDDADENNSSPADTEEIEREDDFDGTPDRAKKRRVG